MRILFTMVKIRDEGNVYGHNKIDILHLNFDGKGSAIVRYDDENEIDYCGLVDLELIMFGDPFTGEKWYKLAAEKKVMWN